MPEMNVSHNAIIVLGYGNTARGDDGLGPRFAGTIENGCGRDIDEGSTAVCSTVGVLHCHRGFCQEHAAQGTRLVLPLARTVALMGDLKALQLATLEFATGSGVSRAIGELDAELPINNHGDFGDGVDHRLQELLRGPQRLFDLLALRDLSV